MTIYHYDQSNEELRRLLKAAKDAQTLYHTALSLNCSVKYFKEIAKKAISNYINELKK